RNGYAFPNRTFDSRRLRLLSVVRGAASHFPSRRKGRAFPHIRRPSRKTSENIDLHRACAYRIPVIETVSGQHIVIACHRTEVPC
ncbi:MAG: hypothetical protein M3Y84_04235, partial [Acidobacteriota bacterium]|nr:hypothetical protein [Acidobacteriota bacterium]